MAKYIHKQAAIYALVNEANIHKNPIKRAYTRAAAIIEQITAEDVQPVKRGEWAWNSEPIFGNPYGSYECSECGDRADFKYNYCCSCGAEMKNAE